MKCKDINGGNCEQNIEFEDTEPQAGVVVTYTVCPIHGRLDAIAEVDD